MTGRADLQRQAVALVYGVADCARRIDAMQANALVLVAYIERCPFVRLLDHIAKNGNDNVGGAKMPLIQRSEVEQLRAEPIGAARGTQQVAVVLQRLAQPKDRAFVQPRAFGEIGERQRIIGLAECLEDRQRSFDCCHSDFRCHAMGSQ